MSQTKRLSVAQRNLVVEIGTRQVTRDGMQFYNRASIMSLVERGLVKTGFADAGRRAYWLTAEGLAVHRELTAVPQA